MRAFLADGCGEGFVEVTGERVAIMTDMAMRAESIDEAKAEEARQRAENRLAEKIDDKDQKEITEVATIAANNNPEIGKKLAEAMKLVGATNGIGYQFQVASHAFDLPATWAWIALLGILGNLLNGLFLVVERAVLAWDRR